MDPCFWNARPFRRRILGECGNAFASGSSLGEKQADPRSSVGKPKGSSFGLRPGSLSSEPPYYCAFCMEPAFAEDYGRAGWEIRKSYFKST